MPFEFRQAICNEIYGQTEFAEACCSIRDIGYTGIEIAPFTLAPDPAAIDPARRKQYRSMIQDSGLTFVGLHWLMVSPEGLHVTTPDRALRKRSWVHIQQLIDLCADLGENGVMVFGSPRQRATDGIGREQATRHFVDGLAGVASHAAERRVTILVEALPLNQCDVVNTLAEAVAIVREIGSPAVRTMFDTHNAVDETEPVASLIDRYFDFIRHVHVNEIDGRHPGAGDYDFKPLLQALRRHGYGHWISLEAFDFTPGPENIARSSLRFLEREIETLAA